MYVKYVYILRLYICIFAIRTSIDLNLQSEMIDSRE